MTVGTEAALSPPVVLLVEDDDIMRFSLEDRLRLEDIRAVSAASLAEARRRLTGGDVSLVVTDVRLPDGSGHQLFEEVSAAHPGVPVIVMTAYGAVPDAVQLIKAGALDYLTKPFDLDDFIDVVRRALAHLEEERLATLVADGEHFRAGDGVLGKSPAMRRVERLVARVAPLESSVLITGESGVGKEVVANLVHANSRRADKPFVKVNCAAIPFDLVESELFGHEKGAFTGAERQRVGRFEQAQGGTILLDEIAEIPPQVQVKLLRVLQERVVERVGGGEPVPLDVRIIAATQVELQPAIDRGAFRADLYWRLNVIRVEVPPLRQRPADILDLARRFVTEFAHAMGKRLDGLSPEAERELLAQTFPGNVRELRNLLERAVALCDGYRIERHDLLPLDAADAEDESGAAASLRAAVAEAEQETIRRVLEQSDWTIGRAASALGISRKNLWEKMRRYGINRPS